MFKLFITIYFSGGAELLFDKVKKHDVTLPAKDTVCMYLVYVSRLEIICLQGFQSGLAHLCSDDLGLHCLLWPVRKLKNIKVDPFNFED